MKLLLENWRRYLIEEQEEVEEGLGTKLAMGAALAGATGVGSPAYADDTNTSTDSETSQQVQSEVETNTLEKNDDGTYSITACRRANHAGTNVRIISIHATHILRILKVIYYFI